MVYRFERRNMSAWLQKHLPTIQHVVDRASMQVLLLRCAQDTKLIKGYLWSRHSQHRWLASPKLRKGSSYSIKCYQSLPCERC